MSHTVVARRVVADPLLTVVLILLAIAVMLLAVPIVTLISSSLETAGSDPTLANLAAWSWALEPWCWQL
jgi:hypothetical protein